MRKILAGLMTLLISCSAAGAGELSIGSVGAPMSLAQYDSRTRTDDRRPRPQRYVCVVQPRESDDRSRPYVCRADAGRVGGTCRCSNVVGTGRLDLDD
ncbi:hypothetical protein ACFFP0_16060 [Rhizobium puerariae]|uniref:Secreted protein n=1 Tax=Rhizobium puerariae TaxID=1585791 RepID=A0ABV6AIC3_9HYPH